MGVLQVGHVGFFCEIPFPDVNLPAHEKHVQCPHMAVNAIELVSQSVHIGAPSLNVSSPEGNRGTSVSSETFDPFIFLFLRGVFGGDHGLLEFLLGPPLRDTYGGSLT
jgi:hypothetical protein